MTLTPAALPAALKTAWSNVRLPHIRVAIPALRTDQSPGRTASHAAQKHELERQFRDDFVELSRIKAQPRAAPDPSTNPGLAAKGMSHMFRHAA